MLHILQIDSWGFYLFKQDIFNASAVTCFDGDQESIVLRHPTTRELLLILSANKTNNTSVIHWKDIPLGWASLLPANFCKY